MTDEKLSCDTTEVDPYKEKFINIVNKLGLTPDLVYNANDSSLFRRLLLKKTFTVLKEVLRDENGPKTE